MKMRLLVAFGALVLLSGCSAWPQARSDGGRSGANLVERTLGVANVGQLAQVASPAVDHPSEAVVGIGGMAYVADRQSNRVVAYDLLHCDQTACPARFSVAGRRPAVVGDSLLVLSDGGVLAYDPAGQRNCSGVPVTCQPIRAFAPPSLGNPLADITDFVVDGDRLLGQLEYDDEGVVTFVASYDVHGVQFCADQGTFTLCQAIGNGGFGDRSDVVAFRRMAALDGRTVEVETDGSPGITVFTGGSGIWATPGTFTGDPVLVGRRLWVANGAGAVDSFDAAGVEGCSTIAQNPPLTCAPRWTSVGPAAATGYGVANDRLYVGSADGRIFVFDAAGSQGCSGVPKHCVPLWTATVDPGHAISAPTIANGVVYAVSSSGVLAAFDAAGTAGCSGAPLVCQPLKSLTLGAPATGPAVVAAGRVLVPTASAERIYGLQGANG